MKGEMFARSLATADLDARSLETTLWEVSTNPVPPHWRMRGRLSLGSARTARGRRRPELRLAGRRQPGRRRHHDHAAIARPVRRPPGRPGERGRVVGTVMSGLLIGILAARTVSGLVGEYLGWRAMYGIAAAVMVALALALRGLLPRSQPEDLGSRTSGSCGRSAGCCGTSRCCGSRACSGR